MARKRPANKITATAKSAAGQVAPAALVEDLRALIRQAREGVARAANAALALLYWEVGHRIRADILKEKRAGYGEQIVPTLSAKLMTEFGNGFSQPNLSRMTRFAEAFPDHQVVATIGLEPLCGNHPAQGPAPAGLLR